jgi:hypothetical protein
LTLLLGISVRRTEADVFTDNFNSAHTYWNGTTANLTGTIWSGIQGTNLISGATANNGGNGQLNFVHLNTLSDGTSPPMNEAALYMNVTGDFDARVQLPVLPPNPPGGDPQFITHSLGAWLNDTDTSTLPATGTPFVHVDNIFGTSNRVRFRTYSADQNVLAIPNANASWLRLVRTADTFTGYYGTDGINWTSFASPITINMMPDTIRVGLATWDSASPHNYTAAFDNFSITTTPEPASLVAWGALGLVATFFAYRRRNARA